MSDIKECVQGGAGTCLNEDLIADLCQQLAPSQQEAAAALAVSYSKGWDEGTANLLAELREDFEPEWVGGDGQGDNWCPWCNMLEPDEHTDDCLWVLFKAGKPHLDTVLAKARRAGAEAEHERCCQAICELCANGHPVHQEDGRFYHLIGTLIRPYEKTRKAHCQANAIRALPTDE